MSLSIQKFIGLSLHPTCGGHFAFRSVLIFPNVLIPEYRESVPPSILSAHEEVREALEKFNYNWKDSGFRDFGNPTTRYSTTQMEFFGRPVAERWEVLRPWIEGGAKDID
uniref:Cyanocobalamin reductase (cyanide-eliminating) n=1 Tax=Caenorhabditis japonica TaxID=281687 RepID=A0A8R1IT65_CAEJA